MAVQIPDPGTGNGQTGDNEYVFRKKVKDNFSDENNAASRLVGEAAGNISTNAAALKNAIKHDYYGRTTSSYKNDANDYVAGDRLYANAVHTSNLPAEFSAGMVSTYNLLSGILYQVATVAAVSAAKYGQTWFRHYYNGWGDWVRYLSTSDTTTDSNGFIKAASPIVKLFSDKIELNSEAEQQQIEFVKNAIGDYTLKNTSGLSADGWYIELPIDANGNAKFAVVYDELADGTINIKTYKRKFDFELVAIVADTDNPTDITDGRWIDLRLNELPQEPKPEV